MLATVDLAMYQTNTHMRTHLPEVPLVDLLSQIWATFLTEAPLLT